MTSGLLSAELSAACNSLGFWSGSSYTKDKYCKETIVDFIRFLRRDEDNHAIRRHLGEANILQTDLIPILMEYSDDEGLFDVLLRLLLILTTPVLMIYQEELPAERVKRHDYLQILSQLQSYKEAFAKQRVWDVLASKLEKLLDIPYQDRDEDQTRMIDRILVLARNVLMVAADDQGEKRPDNDASVHDQVLWCMHQAGMVNLFLYITNTDHEQQFYMHILEIMTTMLREQSPERLTSASLERTVDEKERDEKELLEIRQREKLEKESKVKKYAGSRHSRFGGTYVIGGVKSISDNDLIYHKPLSKAMSQSLIFEKERARVPKNKLAMTYHVSERRSPFSVRIFLKNFCVEFLNGAYNPVMSKVRENLVRGISQNHDETYYFWIMSFFMEFNRLNCFEVKLISETIHQQTFHFVQTKIENWLESMITDKKHITEWSRRVHIGLRAYQELLMTLRWMEKCPDESVQRSASVINRNVFYQSEYRELVIYLFNFFTELKFSKVYLKDLIVTTHILLKMLETFCKKHQTLVVQGKPKKKPSKKTKPTKSKSMPAVANLETAWDNVGPVISAILVGDTDIPTDVVPFNPISGLSMEEEKIEAMKKIKAELMQENVEQAIGLLRAARDVWPENDSFGRAGMPPEEEFLAMRDIFFADMGKLPEADAPQESNTETNDADDEEEEDDSDAHDIEVPETVFKFSDFVGRFACPNVLAAVCLLLESFETNSKYTNHCIVKLLHRVAYDCKMPQMLFQVTVFRTFQRVIKSQNPQYQEIVSLAQYVIKMFGRMAEKNKKIFAEMMFWKTSKEAYELEYGYGSSETKSHSSKNVWEEEQEDELRRLAVEYEQNTPEGEPDAVAWIMKNMINQSRSRKAVIKKMKELYLFVGNMKPKTKKPKEMTEEEINELKGLYDLYKENHDPMNCIMGRLSVPRSRRLISEKLLELGLISDKKELRKKKQKKSLEKDWGERSDDESIYDSWSDEESENIREKKTSAPLPAKPHHWAPSLPHILGVLKRAVDTGEELKEPLEWLQSQLQEALQCQPFESSEAQESIALLPVAENIFMAVDCNPIFQQVLHILSFEKPIDHENFWWRIPGKWKSKDFQDRIEWIKEAMEGKLPDNQSGEQSVGMPESPTINNDGSDNKLQFTGGIAREEEGSPQINHRKRKYSMLMNESDEEKNSESCGLKPKKKPIMHLESDSENESEDEIKYTIEEINKNSSTVVDKKETRPLSEVDSNSDIEREEEGSPQINHRKRKNSMLMNESDEEKNSERGGLKPKRKLIMRLESDSENESEDEIKYTIEERNKNASTVVDKKETRPLSEVDSNSDIERKEEGSPQINHRKRKNSMLMKESDEEKNSDSCGIKPKKKRIMRLESDSENESDDEIKYTIEERNKNSSSVEDKKETRPLSEVNSNSDIESKIASLIQTIKRPETKVNGVEYNHESANVSPYQQQVSVEINDDRLP